MLTLTVTDLFAGAGGSSTGLAAAGLTITAAVNHWPIAIDTHAANHPGSAHECLDISQADVDRFPTTDMLWASPSCTHHTVAQGKRRATGQLDLLTEHADTLDGIRAAEPDRSRATMFDVVRFTERHRYRYVVVENVPEVQDWALYPHWLAMMGALGYQHRIQVLDSARVGTPVAQHRIRYYGLFWRDDQTPPPALAEHDDLLPSEAILDSDIGPLISDRPRPLAPATMQRIEATLDRYPDRQMLVSYYGASKSGRPVSRPMGTLTTKARHALLTRGRRGLHYRMLTLDEQAAAMGFPTDYQWRGTGVDIQKQIGNAVTTNVAATLGAAIKQVAA